MLNIFSSFCCPSYSHINKEIRINSKKNNSDGEFTVSGCRNSYVIGAIAPKINKGIYLNLNISITYFSSRYSRILNLLY